MRAEGGDKQGERGDGLVTIQGRRRPDLVTGGGHARARLGVARAGEGKGLPEAGLHHRAFQEEGNMPVQIVEVEEVHGGQDRRCPRRPWGPLARRSPAKPCHGHVSARSGMA